MLLGAVTVLLFFLHKGIAFQTSLLTPQRPSHPRVLRPKSPPALARLPQRNANLLDTTDELEQENLHISLPSDNDDDEYLNAVRQQQKDNENKQRSWKDDGFVFGLEGSGLERPKGRTALVAVEGDSLETKPYQVALVGVTFVAHAYFLTNSFLAMLQLNNYNLFLTMAQSFLLTACSWVLADFGSGVLHWSVDNYGNGRTPIMGSIIAAFQGHHTAPWTITERGFCNNVHKLCIPFGIIPMALLNMVTGPFTTFFLTTFCVFEILSQEFHKWSHQLPSETPGWVNWMQRVGLSVARKPHAMHHLAPFEGNYCIISGVCNPILDKTGFFRRLEHIIYQRNGVEANAWKLDPLLRQRTLDGLYTPASQ